MITENLEADNRFMTEALRQALMAYEEDEVPIGCVVVANDRVIGKGYNQTQRLQDPTAHAEMIAITAASNSFDGKFLHGCTLYVTIEPCAMCAGALHWSQIDRVVYGAPEPKTGFSRFTPTLLHSRTRVSGGILEWDCRELMQKFFAEKRKGAEK
ncbi:MAG: nucleoside deaminase [Sphingobacteriia bacterium]|nr:nucleoside deaminase [Sphingobacteriia bacterium]